MMHQRVGVVERHVAVEERNQSGAMNTTRKLLQVVEIGKRTLPFKPEKHFPDPNTIYMGRSSELQIYKNLARNPEEVFRAYPGLIMSFFGVVETVATPDVPLSAILYNVDAINTLSVISGSLDSFNCTFARTQKAENYCMFSPLMTADRRIQEMNETMRSWQSREAAIEPNTQFLQQVQEVYLEPGNEPAKKND